MKSKIKKALKNQGALVIIFFLLITLASLVIRFWNFEKNLQFHLDPPFMLFEVKEMVETQKLRLIGPIVSSKTVQGRAIFNGPLYYYFLAILGIVFNWNVVALTASSAFLWMTTFILIFIWLKQRFADWIALIIYALLSFSPLLLPYSRIIWNHHLVPLFGVFFFWLLEKREGKQMRYFLAGLAFGLGLNAHYSAIFWLSIILYYLFADWKKEGFIISSWLFFILGAVLGELPFLIFELRHNFYNLRTLIFQIRYHQPSISYSFSFRYHYYYYIFPLVPLIAKGYALFLKKLEKSINFKIILLPNIALIFFFFFFSLFGPKREALINPDNWFIARQKQIAEMIVKDNEETFEVATVINSDTRAMELRWWLKEQGHEPLGVEEYNQAVVLYLVAPQSRPPEKETVWEIQSLRPFRIEKEVDLGDGYIFYKLRRLEKEG